MKGNDYEKRKTKKDKAKRNFELYGKFTPKHIRQQEELQRIQGECLENNKDTNCSKKKKKEKK